MAEFSAEDAGIDAAVEHARSVEIDGLTLRVAIPASRARLRNVMLTIP